MLDFEALADQDLAEDDVQLGAPQLLGRAACGGGGALGGGGGCGRGRRPRRCLDRRAQVLVLHGRQSNENLVGFQLTGLKQALGKDVDIKFLEGDVVWRYEEGVDNHDADPMTVALAKGRDFKTWFTHTTDDPRDRIDFFKQMDPGVTVTYSGAEKAANKLLRYVDECGPVDAVVGIFEGSIVVHLAVAELLKRGQPVPWCLSVFFGPMCVRDDRLAAPLVEGQVSHPTVHVFGKSDEYRYYQRTAAGRTAPEDYYSDPVLLEHPEGHQLPSPGQAWSKVIYDRIAAELRYRCGADAAPPKPLPRPPKPTSMLLKHLDSMAPRKLRVLALCGGHSCAAVIKFQTSQLRLALGRDTSEWTYIEGGKDWTWFEGEPIVSEAEAKLAGGAQLKNWYMDTCHEEGGQRTKRENRDKQFDPTTYVEYHDIPEAVDRVRDVIYASGPFDVLVAFSQGCILTHLLIGHLRQDPPGGREKYPERWQHARHSAEQMQWRCSVFVGGMHIRDRNYFHLFDTKSAHPTVHVFGKADEYYEYARTGLGNRPQEEYYTDPIVLTHEQGHEFPTAQPRARQIYDKVAAEIWRHCGGRP